MRGENGRLPGSGLGWLPAALLAGLLLPGCGGAGAPAPPQQERSPAQGQPSGAPDWLAGGGASARYPNDAYLTGFAMARGADALARAKAAAAADLSNRISVRIEHALTDASSQRNGAVDSHVAAMTRMTSDVRIFGLGYEIALQGDDVFAFAYVARASAARERRLQRDRAVSALDRCVAAAEQETAPVGNAEAYLGCLRHVAEGLGHDALIQAIDAAGGDQEAEQALIAGLQTIRNRTRRLISGSAGSLREAAEFLAVQLILRQASDHTVTSVAPFRFGATGFSSPLGQQIALHLEGALGRHPGGGAKGNAAVQGVYFEEEGSVRISATLHDMTTGSLLAGAETIVAKAVLPAGVALRPKNLEQAMIAERLLSEGELIEGKLRLEVWADKGRRGVVYTESEEIRIFMRVNTPAYVRLIYVLESGIQVPIDQAYYIDGAKVNLAVEYPDRFEVVPPFGVEHIHATAFTTKPEPLPVETRVIDGIPYEVVSEGLPTVVRHRGIRRKEKEEVAEALLSISTLPVPAIERR